MHLALFTSIGTHEHPVTIRTHRRHANGEEHGTQRVFYLLVASTQRLGSFGILEDSNTRE